MRKGNTDPAKEKYWRSVVARQEESGLTIVAFCELEKFKIGTFQNWKSDIRRRDRQKAFTEAQKLNAQTAKTPQSILVPVSVTDVQTTRAECIEVSTADGVEIRIPVTCPAEVVRQLLAGLRGS